VCCSELGGRALSRLSALRWVDVVLAAAGSTAAVPGARGSRVVTSLLRGRFESGKRIAC